MSDGDTMAAASSAPAVLGPAPPMVAEPPLPVETGADELAIEHRAGREACLLVHRAWRCPFRATGPARIDYLQRIVSGDVSSCAPGRGLRALLLSTKGKIVGDLDVWVEEDWVTLVVDAAVVDDVLDRLRKYVIADPVRFEERYARPAATVDRGGSTGAPGDDESPAVEGAGGPDEGDDEPQVVEAVLGLLGPGAEELLEAVGAAVPAEHRRAIVRTAVDGAAIAVARTPALTVPGFELHVPVDDVGDVWTSLREAGGDRGLRTGGWRVSELLRVERARPRHGAELTGEEFPQEARLDDAIDYEKGCYLGQETVARIHYRGQVNRYLAPLSFDRPVSPGATLFHEGKEVGGVTSGVVSPERGPSGLGYVRREASEPGTRLQVSTDAGEEGEDATATVVEVQ